MHYPLSSDVERVLFSAEQIQARVAELGAQIAADYTDSYPVVIGLLRGAAFFMCDLVRAIDAPVQMEFMGVGSYGSGTVSSGVVTITSDLSAPVEGRDIILVDDVLDTGLTLERLTAELQGRGARSVEIAVMLSKGKNPAINPKYVGFTCPDEYVVGYGMDRDQVYRNLPYVGVLKAGV